MELNLIEQVGQLLLMLALFAEGVQVAIEQLKPIVIDKWAEQHPDLYLPVIFVLRVLLSLLAVLSVGGANWVLETAPVFTGIPEFMVIVLATLLTVAGADLLHALHDFLYGLRDRVRPSQNGIENVLSGIESAKK